MAISSMSQLPDNEKSFDIEIEEGDTTRQHWVGKFTTKCVLNLRERSAADLLQKRMNDGMQTLEEETLIYHLIIAQLEARLTEAPEWWIATENGRELKDLNVLYEIYAKCMEAERDWREKVWGEKEEKEELTSTTEEDEQE